MKTGYALALSSMLLAGCAGRYTPLVVTAAPDPALSIQQNITKTLADLRQDGQDYADTYSQISRNEDLAQVPLIGAAVALAVIAINQPANAAATIGKIGIGTGAYAALKSLFSPSGGQENFRLAVNQVNCVLAQGPAFVGSSVEDNQNNLRARSSDLDRDIFDLNSTLKMQAGSSTPDQLAALNLARANGQLAATAAESISDSARAQLGAYDNAPTEFIRARTTINSNLVAKVAVRTAIDPTALAASWVKPPAGDQKAGPPHAANFDAGQLANKLNESSAAVIDSAAQTKNAVAKVNFVNALKEVVKCPVSG